MNVESAGRRALHVLLLSVGLSPLVNPVLAAPRPFQEPAPGSEVHEMTPLRGDVYLVRNGPYTSVVLSASDGLLVVDPMNVDHARWLQNELQRRFPGRRVRYVIHSSHRWERSSGAWGLGSGVDAIAHEFYNSELLRARRELPAALAPMDLNHNGRLEPDEWHGGPGGSLLASLDDNHDGILTPDELYRSAGSVRDMYRSTRTITLGRTRVVLVHAGLGDVPDLTVLYFPDERVVFSAEHPRVGEPPITFDPIPLGDIRAWIRAVMPLDFDMIVTGSGEVIGRDDVAKVAAYLEEMERGVKEGLLGRFSLPEIQASDLLAAYQSGGQRTIGDTQIAATYRTLHLVTAQVAGAVMLNHLSTAPMYCANFNSCRTGGNTWSASLGAFLAVGRIGGLVELQAAPEYQTERDEALYRDIYSHRDTRTSLLGRYAFRQTRRTECAVVAGIASIESDVRGVAIVKAAYLRPDAGRNPRQQHSSTAGWTVGTDFSTTIRRLDVVVPFRLTINDELSPIPNTGRSSWQLQAGVAFGVRVFNRVF